MMIENALDFAALITDWGVRAKRCGPPCFLLIEGFTKRYGVHHLVYYEMHHTMPEAILREKRLKKWNRAWKVRLIESMNPEWVDLFDDFWGQIHEGPADRARRHIGRDRVDM